MALLRIVRDSGYADRLRAYKVIVDGKTAGEIRNGEAKEIPISGGQHDLSLKIDWCGSKTIQFTIAHGDVLTRLRRREKNVLDIPFYRSSLVRDIQPLSP